MPCGRSDRISNESRPRDGLRVPYSKDLPQLVVAECHIPAVYGAACAIRASISAFERFWRIGRKRKGRKFIVFNNWTQSESHPLRQTHLRRDGCCRFPQRTPDARGFLRRLMVERSATEVEPLPGSPLRDESGVENRTAS